MNAFDRMVRKEIDRLCAVTGYSEEELREMDRIVDPPRFEVPGEKSEDGA